MLALETFQWLSTGLSAPPRVSGVEGEAKGGADEATGPDDAGNGAERGEEIASTDPNFPRVGELIWGRVKVRLLPAHHSCPDMPP